MPYSPALFLSSNEIAIAPNNPNLLRRNQKSKFTKKIILTMVSIVSAAPFAVNSALLPFNKDFWHALDKSQPDFPVAMAESIILATSSGLCNAALNYKGCSGFSNGFFLFPKELYNLIFPDPEARVSPRAKVSLKSFKLFSLHIFNYIIGGLTILPNVSSGFYNAPLRLSLLATAGAVFMSAVYADNLLNWFRALPENFKSKRNYRHATKILLQGIRLQSAEQLRDRLIEAINRVEPNQLALDSELAAIESAYERLNRIQQGEALFIFMRLNGVALPGRKEKAIHIIYKSAGLVLCGVSAWGAFVPTVRLWYKLRVESSFLDWFLSTPGFLARFVLFESSWSRFFFKLRCLGLLTRGSGLIIASSTVMVLITLGLGLISSTGYLNTVLAGKGMQSWYDAILPVALGVSTAVITLLNSNALYDFLVNILRSLMENLGQAEVLFLERALDKMLKQNKKEMLDQLYSRAQINIANELPIIEENIISVTGGEESSHLVESADEGRPSYGAITFSAS